MVQQTGVIKSNIYFEMKIVKVLDKHQKLKTSLLSLKFFKVYMKLIKKKCKENGGDFKIVFYSMM